MDEIAKSSCRGTATQRGKLIEVIDDAFGEQETRGEFDVVTGSTHGDGERRIVDADLERFFGGEGVVDAPQAAAVPLENLGELKTARRR